MTDTGPATKVSEVVVTGQRIRFEYQVPTWMLGPPPILPPEHDEKPMPGDGGGGDDPPCQSTTGMSDAQKLQALLRFAAAVWREQVKANAVQNAEWGTAFYIDGNGNLQNTSLEAAVDHRASIRWGDLPKYSNGVPRFDSVIGIAHTHPRFNHNPETGDPNFDYFDPTDPARLLRPSPNTEINGTTQLGDWAAYDWVFTNATNQISYGGAGPNSALSLIIVGFDGIDLAINQYGATDRADGQDGYTSLEQGGASDGQSGARGSMSIRPLPPCSD